MFINWSVLAKLAKLLTGNIWKWKCNLGKVAVITGKLMNQECHSRAKGLMTNGLVK